MKYQDFKEKIREHFINYYGSNARIQIEEVKKNNGLILDGLSILESGKIIAPTIYLNPYYSKYQDGLLSFDEIISNILVTHTTYSQKAPIEALSFTDFFRMKSHIMFKLINYNRNRNLLKDIPHIPYLDLAICFYCMIEGPDKALGSILIRNEHLELWNVSEHDLYEIALHNTLTNLPPTLFNLEEFFFPSSNHSEPLYPKLSTNVIHEQTLPYSVYVLSNQHNMFGAATIIYEQLLMQLSNSMHSSFALLPSSIHEVLIVPVSNASELDHYTEMVRNVNEQEVSVDEILSDHAYFYDRTTHTLTFSSAN